MIDGTGFVDSEKRVLCTTEVKRIRIVCSNAILFFGPFVVLRKKNQTLPSDCFGDLCCHMSLCLSHCCFPVMKFSLCPFLTLYFEGLIAFIDLIFISFFVHGTVLPQVVIWCDTIHWRHCAKSRSRCFSPVFWFVMRGGNSALNPACSLWQYYLWTVVRHAVFWGCQMFFETNTLPESVLPQAHSDTNKDAVIHYHFHWLQGPKCKQTQITEKFAPIKHSNESL